MRWGNPIKTILDVIKRAASLVTGTALSTDGVLVTVGGPIKGATPFFSEQSAYGCKSIFPLKKQIRLYNKK